METTQVPNAESNSGPNAQATPLSEPPFVGDDEVAVAVYSHQRLTLPQWQEIEEKSGQNMGRVHNLSDAATGELKSHRVIDEIWAHLRQRLSEILLDADAVTLFGIFPTPVQSKFVQWDRRQEEPNVYLYGSFHRPSRQVKTFNHIQWQQVGKYHLDFSLQRVS